MRLSYRLLALAALAPMAFAASTPVTLNNIPATARIIAPNSITNNGGPNGTAAGISWGDITVAANAPVDSVIRIAATDGTRSVASGNATLPATSTMAHHNASFIVTGSAAAGTTFTVPTTSVLLTHLTNPTATMTASNFTLANNGSAVTLTTGTGPLPLDATSFQTVATVGADLKVSATQLPGDYAGTFSVTVVFP